MTDEKNAEKGEVVCMCLLSVVSCLLSSLGPSSAFFSFWEVCSSRDAAKREQETEYCRESGADGVAGWHGENG